MSVEAHRYQPMTLVDLGRNLASAHSESERRRLVLEFVEEYRWEPREHRALLVAERPEPTGDPRYDALLAGLAEHLAYHDVLDVPGWAYDDDRFLEQWWFPIDLPSVRAEALVHSPGAFRIRGIFIGSGAFDRA
jgi:hypothetical protein